MEEVEMSNFLTRRNRQEPTAAPAAAETRQEAFANAVAALRQATGKAEARVIPCRCAVTGEPFGILFERMSPAHRFQIARIEGYEATAPHKQKSAGGLFSRKPQQQSYAASEFDWTGCVCPHCGSRAGVVYCNGCGETVCAGRVRPLPDGNKAFACHDGCGATGTTGPASHVRGGAGTSHLALGRTLQLPAPSTAGQRQQQDAAPLLPGRQPR
jgi:hypothetical protein